MRVNSFFVLFFSLFLVNSVYGQSVNPEVVGFIKSVYSPRAFTDGVVSDEDINEILLCGSRAPSATNRQPWHFTVVKDPEVSKKLIAGLPENNILIVVSSPGSGADYHFDCAIATQNMFLASQALGYGARIYTGPVRNINANFLSLLTLPQGFKVISILRVGTVDDTVDAVTAATPRKDLQIITNFK